MRTKINHTPYRQHKTLRRPVFDNQTILPVHEHKGSFHGCHPALQRKAFTEIADARQTTIDIQIPNKCAPEQAAEHRMPQPTLKTAFIEIPIVFHGNRSHFGFAFFNTAAIGNQRRKIGAKDVCALIVPMFDFGKIRFLPASQRLRIGDVNPKHACGWFGYGLQRRLLHIKMPITFQPSQNIPIGLA